jgi:hypothetical protein
VCTAHRKNIKSLYFIPLEPNQPTEKLTKSGDLLKRMTLSLARLNGLLSISSSLLPVSDFCQPLVGTSVFQGTELKGYPHRLTSSQTSDVIGNKRNPQNLANLPVANVPRYVSCNAKTHVCNICSFCTLVWAADLQTGHA